MNNQSIAKVLHSNKLATKEQIHAHWAKIASGKDIAQILVDEGILKESVYPQLMAHVSKIAAKKKAKEAAAAVEAPPEKVVEPQEEAHEVPVAEEQPLQQEQPQEVASIVTGNSPYGTAASEAPLESAISLSSANPYGEISVDPTEIETASGVEATQIGNLSIATPKEVEEETVVSKEAPVSTKPESPEEPPQDVLPKNFEGVRGDGELGFTPPKEFVASLSLEELLVLARDKQASDIHLSTASPIAIRRFGHLKYYGEALTNQQIERILSVLPEDILAELKASGDIEFIHTVVGAGRYRMTIMKHRSGFDLTARVISQSVIPFADSGMPKTAEGLTKWAQGLVLVTGPVGCGKTTALSTLVQMVNEDRKDHIITVESPIEIVYPEAQCQMTQREVGMHTMSQANALKGALRQDPDILVVSELRDLESIELAVSAAETGHLVFGTMNTTNAGRTISRLVDSFPPEEQDIVRSMVSESLRGVISQQMIPRKDGEGVVIAYEVLIVNAPVANLIRKNELHQLESAMMTGQNDGMVLLDNSLQELLDADLIDGEEAYYRANSPKRFEKYLGDHHG